VFVETIPRNSREYPPSLNELTNPPSTIWAIGNLALLDAPCVAVVGTRRSTAYGERITRELAGALARGGACVISGMALGIDGVAHRAALEANGRTVAVLGTGVDVAYPRAHLALHREIAERGSIISELPPGAKSHGGSFPNRNRIIAALANLVVVVEAPIKSGALITANHALELGRDVAVVPGPIDSPQCAGSNELLHSGAHPIISVADLLTLAKLAPQPRAAPAIGNATEERVWLALATGVATLDELCARAELPVAQCLAAVTGLELRGAVECALTGEIRRR
jgi:DNA processing protein